MIKNAFGIDFKNKTISYKGKKSSGEYSVQNLYSFLMDLLDEPENMKYDIPIEPVSKGEFRLINGWTIDEKAKKHLNGEALKAAS